MSLLKRFTLLLSALAVVFTVSGGVLAPIHTAYAQVDELETVGETSGLQDESLQIIVARLIRTFLTVLGVIAVVIVLYGGFVWMTAQGDPDKVDKAKKILLNGFIGLGIILLSWSITTFVLGALTDGSGGSGSSSSSSSSGASSGMGGGSASSFAVASYSPEGEVSIRNVVLNVTFSRRVQEDTVEGNLTISNTETGDEVDGTLEISGNKVTFTPSEPCPEPNEDRFCFGENTQYTVVVDSDIDSTSGTSLDCSAVSCTSTFTTGDIVDTEDPNVSVTYPDSGEMIPADSSTLVQISATDDSEISVADFYAGDDWFDSVAASGADLSDVTIESTWYTDDAEEDARYTLEVTVTDIAGNEDSDSVRIRILPAHCFSRVLDGDEEGVDCGGSCGSCDGESCSEDSDCSGGDCEDGACVTYPEISSVSPSNGAVGTYVTISGSGFGSTGSVYFADGAGGTVEADIPSCGDGWNSEEIIAEVPDGAADGPITIEIPRGYSDATDDDSGALIDDFDVNDTQRPSLCNVSPDTAEVGDGVSLSGLGFGDSRDDSFVSFNTTTTSSYSRWSDSSLTITVPSLTAGEYVDLSVTVDGVTSNEISFGVDYGDDIVPTIYSVEPDSGGIGQYVTISGTSFGSSLGTVWFEDQTSGYTAQGSIEFPDECEGQIWDTTEITVIVPDEFTGGDSLTVGDYDIYITSQADIDSEAMDFEVTNDDPTPGICAIDPDMGEVDDTVVIYGENLGSDIGSVEFFSGVSATVVSGDWSDSDITVNVPSGAQTGALSVTSAGGEESNTLNFEIGAEESSDTTLSLGGYSWFFSTGPIPVVPELLVECSDTLVSAVPNYRFTREACTNAVVRGTFSTLMDTSTITSDYIKVYECEDSDCDLSGDDKDAAEVLADSVQDSASATQTSFIWTAHSTYNGGKFKTSTSYLVEVSDQIMSQDGQNLSQEYSWTFTTGASEEDCDVSEVLVSPISATIDEQGDESEFNALPLQECQVLNPVDYSWDWDLDTGSYVGLTSCATISDEYCQSAVAVAEGTTVLTAEEQASGTEGDAEVIVNFADPYVSDYLPDCDTACINGAISVTFNTLMDDSVLGDIALYSCANELCATLSEITTVASCSDTDSIGDSTDIESVGCSEVALVISDTTYGTELKEAEYYRVIVSGSAISTSGVPLSRTNYGDDFSWTFGTKDDDALCLVGRIGLEPENITLDSIGDTQYYEVTAYGDPDSCSVAGQELNGYEYEWVWTDPIVDDEDVAQWVTISSDLFDVGQTNIPSGCTSECVATGSEIYYGICGNGIVEIGEDCDDTDDVTCSSTCQNVGSSACTYSCSSTGDSCSTDVECQDVCEISDTETLEGTCSISGTVCGSDEECVYSSSTCGQDDASCCGDGDLDAGEECDDSNSRNGDGCSSSCLNEGSQSVGATCGNLDEAHEDDQGGEECDDGNASSGDGCSSVCLNEGTTPITQVAAECGDGDWDIDAPYETCDDGNTIDGDGCSSSCLREGSAGSYGTCGDESLDQDSSTGAGEDCDGEEWCSSDCLLSGSSIYYVDPSVCGDGVVGSGELAVCEESSYGAGPDGYPDPVQLAQIIDDAAEQVDMDTNIATSTIEVSYDGLSAYTSLYLSCVAENDDDCDEGYGPATTGCCMARPDPDLFPNGSSACLNAEIYGLFDMQMDVSSFDDNAFLILDVSTTDDGLCPSTHSTIAMNEIQKGWWSRAFSLISRMLAPIVQAQNGGDCVMPMTGFAQSTVGEGADEVYKVVFHYDEALAPDAQYSIYVYGDELDDTAREGLLTRYGVAMDGDHSQIFETYQSICGLDEVDIVDGETDSPNVFTESGESHEFSATAYSYDTGAAQSIEPISSYAWGWVSWSSDADGVDVYGAPNGEDIIMILDDETVDLASPALGSYSAAGITGQANIATSAIVTVDDSGESFYCSSDASITGCTPGDACGDSGTCEATTVSGTADVSVVVCENLWPALEYFPFSDSADGYHAGVATSARHGRAWMNFSTYYCRDDGDDDLISDDYPELRVVMAQEHGTDDVLKEYFFNVYDDNIPTGDAIGMRIIMNEAYLSPLAWYYANGFSGSPTETTIDGFQAVVDGRSIYVAVPNYVSGSLYPNIVIVSYNYGASSTAVEIYDMFIENMSLVNNIDDTAMCYRSTDGDYGDSCTSDLDCTTVGYECADEKSKLMRDMDRLGDVTDIASYMGGTIPQIESGSFVRSLTSSVWTSWNDVLADELGVSVAADPLNQYILCGTGRYSDYDSETCVNEITGQYLCPVDSRTYHYRTYGDAGYVIGAELEFEQGSWVPDIDNNIYDDYQILIGGSGTGDGFQNGAAFCDGSTVWGSSDICGDGIVGSAETCEIGDTTSGAACDSDEDGVNDGYILNNCNSECSGYDATLECEVLSCGNGVLEAGEECDDGSLNGSYGFCGADCTNSARTYCGDGELAGGELCDCGSVAPASGAAYGAGACTYLNGVYSASASDTCAWDCSGPAPYCGDSTADDSEECDGNTETYSGKICSSGMSDNDGECEQDSDCASGTFGLSDGDDIDIEAEIEAGTAVCGDSDPDDISKDTANECPYTTVCIDGDASKTGEPCGVNSYCDSSVGGDGICSTFEYQTIRTRSCDDSVCEWGEDWADIDCIAPGSCGDGVVDDGEECDDGNDDSTDDCTIECTSNVCGDGYVYAGMENCDEGIDNGQICSATYGSTCAYCNESCVNVTTSGSFCGDGVINGSETCDGTDVLYNYYSETLYQRAGLGIGETCLASDYGLVDDEGRSCVPTGVCEGGDAGGAAWSDGSYCSPTSELCMDGISTCVAPSCDASCESTCPFTYTAQSISMQTNQIGASRSYTVDLAPYDATATSVVSGDTVTLYIPACTVSDGISISIDQSDREYPDVEIMFVIDLSGSMSSELGDSTRIEVLESAVSDAITSLHEAYDGTSANMGIGWAYIGGTHQTYTAPVDTDGDGIVDEDDNCPDDSNSSQTDTDGDGIGDECEEVEPDPVVCDCGEMAVDVADCEALCEDDDSSTDDGLGDSGTSGTDGVGEADDATVFTPGLKGTKLASMSLWDQAMSSFKPLIAWASYASSGEGKFLMLEAASSAGVYTTESDTQLSISDGLVVDGVTGTPIYESIEDAALGFSGYADNEYMIIFTDGNIYNTDYESLYFDHIDTEDTDGDDVMDTDEYMRGVSNLLDDIKDAGVEVFSAVLSSNDCQIAQMQRWSSMECTDISDTDGGGSCGVMTTEGNHDCVVPDNGTTYAYSATTANELADMYEAIVDAILNVTISLTFDGETEASTVGAGSSRSINLPSTFACDESSEQTVTLRVSLNGEGTVELSDMYLNMCTD
ncbi:hypothetical protein HN358_05075 [Candidatus Uhrbacteria bacterium]|jgi:cysteine-rich repeat protein|nr:hypothetical protein [Candidatus Uhrbacteria bacterium]MBT7716763.1 hypothetical protein [Candidatus Uhrbacteria bacterium]